MKHNVMKQLLVTLLVLALLIPAAVLGEDEFLLPIHAGNYNYTSSVSASLSINNGVASCDGFIIPSANNVSSEISVRLQRQEGTVWRTIYTWTGSGTNGDMAFATGSKSVSRGYSYRVYAVGKIKDSGGNLLETVSATSPVKSY